MADTKPEAEALLPTVGSHWLHRKSGGTYYVLAVGKIEADLIPAVVYQSTYDDKVWVRPLANFMDGRFEQTPDPRAALPPKPLSVAPDDEALFKRFRRAWTPNDTDAEEVLEALRRRIAELRAEVAAKDEEFVNADTRAALAKSALAACRDKTIEECAALAADYAKIRGGYIPVDPIKAQNEAAKEIAAGIRALKDKKPGV